MATNSETTSVPAPKPASMQTNQMTGSLITVITNALVRYEGTLITIDRAERSMRLKNVQSFGTEGRRNGENEIPAHSNVIPEVVFKVDHIKDFQIVKRPEAEEAKPKESLSDDPAIISSQQEVTKEESKPQQQKYGQKRQQEGNDKPLNKWKGEDQQPRQPRPRREHKEPEKITDNFDYSTKNLESEKVVQGDKPAKAKAEDAKESDSDEEDGAAGFFDSISNANDEKRREKEQMANGENRWNMVKQQRDKNNTRDADTFGSQLSQEFRYTNSNRGRGGRGGRGRGQGEGGRGGNSNWRGRGRDGADGEWKGGHNNNYRGREDGGNWRGRGDGNSNYRGGRDGGDGEWKSYSNNYRGREDGGNWRGREDGGNWRGRNNNNERGGNKNNYNNRRGGGGNSAAYANSTGDPTIDNKQ